MAGLLELTVLAAAIGSGIAGGIFFAFSSFVMSALGRVAPAEGMRAMRAINVAVINPTFMIVFLGTALLCAGVAVVSLLRWEMPGSGLRLGASLLYTLGCFGSTLAFNVPLNSGLAAIGDSAESAEFWARYRREWTRWNHVRTIAAIGAAVLFTISLRAMG